MTDTKPSPDGDDSGPVEIVGTSPATPGDGAGGTTPAPDEAAKSAFEAAIERKKAAGQARSAHLDGGAKVGGATASHKTSRTFRRKSG